MTFSSQRDAKQFLANKIVAEAQRHGTPLSEPERLMLLFTEQEPETVAAIPQEMLDDNVEYEKKITDLLQDAYQRESDNDLEREQYKDAVRVLTAGDHYISIMAEAALARPKAQGNRVRDVLLYIAIGVAVVAGAVVYALWAAR